MELLDASYQGDKRLFVFSYDNTEGNNQVSVDSFKKHFLSWVKNEDYNIEIDRRNFYDQSINDLIKKYEEVRKVLTGQGDDYATGCLMDFSYFKNSYRLRKQKALDDDSRAIQQIIFTDKIKAELENKE